METRKNFGTTIIAAIVSYLLTVISCSTRQTAEDFVPAEPNYDKPSQWYVTDRQGQADIFYIISTETGDYLRTDGSTCHYADTYADSLRAPLLGEMKGVDTLLSGRLNFYAPYYRQCSLQSFGSDSVARERLPLAVDDVRRAFAHYLKNNNQGRPFILAGFSQGAVIALQLMSEMNDETYARMVAAYIIGTNISQEMLDNNSRIRPAQGADDTGVTICYNSVRDASCTLWPRSAVAINPVNWRTDSQEATLITEPTPLQPVAAQQKDTLTVHLDTASNLLFVSGYSATDYVLPLIGKEGNYHSREIWLYRDQLRENIQQRVSAFK
jgi:hypothetical protein